MSSRRLVQASILTVAILGLVPAVAAADCTAEVQARQGSDLVSDRAITKVFSVEVQTSESCAQVFVDLVVTERSAEGRETTSTVRGSRKVTSRGTTYQVRHQIARDSTLTDWEFKVTRCVPCTTNQGIVSPRM